MKPGQQQHVGGANTGDQFQISVRPGPAMKRVNTTTPFISRKYFSRRRWLSIVLRASGTSSGAPCRTKSFCISTTMRAVAAKSRSSTFNTPCIKFGAAVMHIGRHFGPADEIGAGDVDR